MYKYSIQVIEEGLLGIIPSIVTAILYWFMNRNEKFGRKIILILPNFILTISFVIMAFISDYIQPTYYSITWNIYQGFIVLALLAVIPVFLAHKSSKWLHVTQLLTFFSALIFWLIGGMAITHDWI